MKHEPLLRFLSACVLAVVAAGCSDSGGTDADGPPPGNPPEGDELDAFRYEPDEPLDVDNVMYYGDGPLELLTDLGPPPNSGFRLVAPPRTVEPGADSTECVSWAMPDLKNRWIYTSVLHTTPGLHHANLYGVPTDPVEGPEEYPNCRVRADVRMFGQVITVLQDPGSLVTCEDPVCDDIRLRGESLNGSACDLSTCSFSGLTIPVVLFANSTQVTGSEQYAFADGYAYEMPSDFEVVTDSHMQNTTPDALRVESAWDFYTMPMDAVTNPTVMFTWFWTGLLIPPRATKTLKTTCDWDGGEVVALMPHTHQWATGFDVQIGTAQMGGNIPTLGTFQPSRTIYDRKGTGQSDSDIQIYYPPEDTSGHSALQFNCHFHNTTDHDMVFGVGENEMCFLFGYTSPPEGQRLGFINDSEGDASEVTERPCLTLDPYDFENNPFLVSQL